MKTIPITKLREMTGVELVVLDEPVRVTSNKTPICYVLPASMWHEYELALAGADEAQGEGDDG